MGSIAHPPVKRRADGWDISIEMTLARIQVHDGKGFILAARDITGKIQSEQRLRIASSAIEQSLLASIIIRDDDVIDYVNPKFSLDTTGTEIIPADSGK